MQNAREVRANTGVTNVDLWRWDPVFKHSRTVARLTLLTAVSLMLQFRRHEKQFAVWRLNFVGQQFALFLLAAGSLSGDQVGALGREFKKICPWFFCTSL